MQYQNIVLISEFSNQFARKKKDTLGGHVKKGAKIGAGVGGAYGAATGAMALGTLKKHGVKIPKSLGAGILIGNTVASSIGGAVKGSLAGAGVYGGKKVLKKRK